MHKITFYLICFLTTALVTIVVCKFYKTTTTIGTVRIAETSSVVSIFQDITIWQRLGKASSNFRCRVDHGEHTGSMYGFRYSGDEFGGQATIETSLIPIVEEEGIPMISVPLSFSSNRKSHLKMAIGPARNSEQNAAEQSATAPQSKPK